MSIFKRKDWTPGPGARVCSTHFISNKPSSHLDENNPDWAPTLKMGHDEVSIVDHSRYECGKRRRLCANLPEVVSDNEHKEASGLPEVVSDGEHKEHLAFLR